MAETLSAASMQATGTFRNNKGQRKLGDIASKGRFTARPTFVTLKFSLKDAVAGSQHALSGRTP